MTLRKNESVLNDTKVLRFKKFIPNSVYKTSMHL